MAQHLEICLGISVWIEGAVRPIRRIGPPRPAHPAVNYEMGDVDAFWPEFARRALSQTTQGKFAHRKSCREPVPLDDGAGAGQQDRAALPTPDIDLATIPDTAENPHLAASEPEVVTYADVDTGGVPALWCIP